MFDLFTQVVGSLLRPKLLNYRTTLQAPAICETSFQPGALVAPKWGLRDVLSTEPTGCHPRCFLSGQRSILNALTLSSSTPIVPNEATLH